MELWQTSSFIGQTGIKPLWSCYYLRHGRNIVGFLVSCDFGFVKLNFNVMLLSDVSGQIIPPIPKKEKSVFNSEIWTINENSMRTNVLMLWKK